MNVVQKLKANISFFRDEEKQNAEWKAALEKEREEFLQNIANLELTLQHVKPLRRLGTSELIGYVQNILHFGVEATVYPSDRRLEQQIYSPAFVAEKDGLYHGDQSIKVCVLHELPKECTFGLLRHFLDAIPAKNWDYVWCLTDGATEVRGDFNLKRFWFRYRGGASDALSDLDLFERHTGYGRPFGKQSVRLLLYSPTDAQIGRLKSAATSILGVRMIPETEIPIHVIATSLPLNCSLRDHPIKGMTREISLEDAMAFLPLFAGPKRMQGTRWLISRSGTPTRLDMFSGETLRTTCVLGQARAGKSSNTNVLCAEFLDAYPDGLLRIVDARTSYEKLCDLAGGLVVDFSAGGLIKNPYSPFALGEDISRESIETLFELLRTAISLGSNEASLDGIHGTILKEALLRCYDTHQKNVARAVEDGARVAPHPIWEDVAAEFDAVCQVLEHANIKGLDKAKSDLVKWGLALEQSGEFEYFFSVHETKTQVSPTCPMVVYDVGEIGDNARHALLAAQIAATQIRKDIVRDFGRSIPKALVFEEFGILVRGSGAAAKYASAFISNMVKTAAKKNAFVLSVTNSVEDYAATDAGRDIWQNATQNIFLPLGEGMVAAAKRAWGEEYNVAEWQIIHSLKMEKEYRRSAAYIRSKKSGGNYQASVYLPLTSELDALITSNDSQLKLYHRLKNEGLTPREALAFMATHHPFGDGL